MQDAAIARAKEGVNPKSMSLGRFLEAVRAKANLTRLDVGARLQKSDEYVLRLERGDLNPAELPARDLADVVELFRLVVTMVAEMILVSVETMSTKQNIRASARSHVDCVMMSGERTWNEPWTHSLKSSRASQQGARRNQQSWKPA
jgi:transcriptional regulator with XRE-family HTH domain